LPYIAAITIAVGVFRTSGALDALMGIVAPPFEALGIPREILPLELLRPFSGSASTALLGDVFAQYGPDSEIGRISSVLMGSSETLFYTVALYFGSVGITKTRHTISASLLAEFVSVILIVNFVKYFFA
jgi:spore maturation protein B